MALLRQKFEKQYLVVFLMSISVVFSGSLIAPIEQRFISSLTENNALMGFTFTFGTLSVAVISWILARLSRVYGKNKFIIAGATLGIIYPLIYATSRNILQYIGGKLVFGFAGAAMGPLLYAYLQDYLSSHSNQGRLLGYLYSAQSAAGSLGAIAGGFLADRYFLGMPYYFQSIVLTIPFFLALKYFNKKEKIQKRKEVDYLFGFKYILSKPYLLYHLILEIPFKMNWAVKVVLYPLIVVSFINSNVVTGSIFATQGFTAMITLPLAGRFVDRKSYMPGMKTAFLVLAFASSMMAFSTSLLMFWVFAALFAVGEAISGPSKGVLEIENIENEHRAEIIAVFSIFGFSIEALSPLLAGILLTFLMPQTVLFVYSLAIWTFLGIATVILKKRMARANK